MVLCGGESRRMGRPKAWLPFGPEVMLQRVVRLVGTVAGPIVVVAAPGQGSSGASARRSRSSATRSPAEGRCKGWRRASRALGEEADLVYATGTDVPFLEPRWITHLAELDRRRGSGDSLDRWLLPLAGCALSHARSSCRRSGPAQPRPSAACTPWSRRSKHESSLEHEMRAVDPELGTLRNLNHPEEYERALSDGGFG